MAMLQSIVRRVNLNIQTYPKTSFAVAFTAAKIPFLSLCSLFAITGTTFSPNFTIAYVCVRALRRFRLPIDIAASGALAKSVPSLSEIKLSELNSAFIKKDDEKKLQEMMGKAKWVMDAADNYGAAFVFTRRMNGVMLVLLAKECLDRGVDVGGWVAEVGVPLEAVDLLGTVAAASVVSQSVVSLVQLYSMAYLPAEVAYACRFLPQSIINKTGL